MLPRRIGARDAPHLAAAPRPALCALLGAITPIPQTVPVSCVWLFVADQAPAYVAMTGAFTPDDCLKPTASRSVVYFALSAK